MVFLCILDFEFEVNELGWQSSEWYALHVLARRALRSVLFVTKTDQKRWRQCTQGNISECHVHVIQSNSFINCNRTSSFSVSCTKETHIALQKACLPDKDSNQGLPRFRLPLAEDERNCRCVSGATG